MVLRREDDADTQSRSFPLRLERHVLHQPSTVITTLPLLPADIKHKCRLLLYQVDSLLRRICMKGTMVLPTVSAWGRIKLAR